MDAANTSFSNRIDAIIRILSKEYHKYEEPSVTKVSKAKDPYKVLVSCLISLRTKDTVTYPASERLFKLADTAKKMMNLSTKQIEKAIYPAGFYKTKAKRIKEISKILIDKYSSKVPDTMEELLNLKGVGRKTAAITLVYGFNKPDYIPVDVHVHVIANRLGWVKTNHPDKTMIDLMATIPKRYWYDINNLLVTHGKNTCVTSSPICSRCAINNYCPKIGVRRSR